MNLAVNRDRWRIPPRYIGYDIMLRGHLADGPDGTLIEKCHQIIRAGVQCRYGRREFGIAELGDPGRRSDAIEAAHTSQRALLSQLVSDIAHLPAQTDLGLTFKSDTMIHLVEDFDLESLPAIVSLARIFAQDVSDRFLPEAASDGPRQPNLTPENADRDLRGAVQHARNSLVKRDLAALEAATLARSLPPGRADDVAAAELALGQAERAVDVCLDQCRLLWPDGPSAIRDLAELIVAVLSARQPHRERLAAGDFSRNLAGAVLCHVSADLLPGPIAAT